MTRNNVVSFNSFFPNARSLVNNFDSLCAYAEAENLDIVGISETWSRENIRR